MEENTTVPTLPVPTPAGPSLREAARMALRTQEHAAEHLGDYDRNEGCHRQYAQTRAVLYALAHNKSHRASAHTPIQEAKAALRTGHAYRAGRPRELGGAHLWVTSADPKARPGTSLTAAVPNLPGGVAGTCTVTFGQTIIRYQDVIAFISAEDEWRWYATLFPHERKALDFQYVRQFTGMGQAPRIPNRARDGAAFFATETLLRLGWGYARIRAVLGHPDQVQGPWKDPAWDCRRVWMAMVADPDIPAHPEVFSAQVQRAQKGEPVRAAFWERGRLRNDFVVSTRGRAKARVGTVLAEMPGAVLFTTDPAHPGVRA